MSFPGTPGTDASDTSDIVFPKEPGSADTETGTSQSRQHNNETMATKLIFINSQAFLEDRTPRMNGQRSIAGESVPRRFSSCHRDSPRKQQYKLMIPPTPAVTAALPYSGRLS